MSQRSRRTIKHAAFYLAAVLAAATLILVLFRLIPTTENPPFP